jgi:hypothetical protein
MVSAANAAYAAANFRRSLVWNGMKVEDDPGHSRILVDFNCHKKPLRINYGFEPFRLKIMSRNVILNFSFVGISLLQETADFS